MNTTVPITCYWSTDGSTYILKYRWLCYASYSSWGADGFRSAFSCIAPSVLSDMILEGCTEFLKEYEIQNTAWKLCPGCFTWHCFLMLLLEDVRRSEVLFSCLLWWHVILIKKFLYTKSRTHFILWFSLSHAASFGEWNDCRWQRYIFLLCYCFINYF